MVKWSACLPSTPTIRVQILLTPAVFSVKFVVENNNNKQKEAGVVGPFFKKEMAGMMNLSKYFYSPIT